MHVQIREIEGDRPPDTAPRQGVLCRGALVEDDVTAVKRVAVVRGGRANWIKIRPGASSDGWTEVRAPSLADGLPVIVPGQRGLPDSARIKVER